MTTVTPGLMRTGSYAGVWLRGQHEKERRWFAGVADAPLASVSAQRAAAQIIEAARRATEVDPGAVKASLSDARRRRYHQPTPDWAGS